MLLFHSLEKIPVFCTQHFRIIHSAGLINAYGSLDQIRIINNVFFGARPHFYSCFVKGNIFLGSLPYDGGGNTYYANMAKEDIGDDFVNIGEKEWADLFVNYNDGSISSDFHFKDEYKLYKDYGVYGGTGFNTSGQPPLPFFESKSIPEQTDAEGNLTIHIRVNNGEKKAE